MAMWARNLRRSSGSAGLCSDRFLFNAHENGESGIGFPANGGHTRCSAPVLGASRDEFDGHRHKGSKSTMFMRTDAVSLRTGRFAATLGQFRSLGMGAAAAELAMCNSAARPGVCARSAARPAMTVRLDLEFPDCTSVGGRRVCAINRNSWSSLISVFFGAYRSIMSATRACFAGRPLRGSVVFNHRPDARSHQEYRSKTDSSNAMQARVWALNPAPNLLTTDPSNGRLGLRARLTQRSHCLRASTHPVRVQPRREAGGHPGFVNKLLRIPSPIRPF